MRWSWAFVSRGITANLMYIDELEFCSSNITFNDIIEQPMSEIKLQLDRIESRIKAIEDKL